jgi:hypothetical protein
MVMFIAFATSRLDLGAYNFTCDIPVVFYRINTLCITSSQNTTNFIALYCKIC